MDIEIRKLPRYAEVLVRGRLDAQWAGDLDSQLSATVRGGARDLRLDMSGIIFMSSAGIRILIKQYKELAAIKGSFSVVSPSEQVRTVLEMAGLLGILTRVPEGGESLAGSPTQPGSAIAPAPSAPEPASASEPALNTGSRPTSPSAPEPAPASEPALNTGSRPTAPSAPEPAPASEPDTTATPAPSIPAPFRLEGGSIAVEAPIECGGLRLSLLGDPARFSGPGFSAADLAPVSATATTMAFGLGAFGSGFDDCSGYFGEFLAAGGAAACVPANASRVPDFMLLAGSFVPVIQTLYAAVCTGDFPRFFQFEARSRAAPLPLSGLVQAATSMCGPGPCAFLMLAETSGLVGVHLTRSPVENAGASPWEFPGIRDRFSFCAEAVWPHSLALVTGIIADESDADISAYARPFGMPGRIGHFHAAALSYRALPEGRLEASIIRELFETQSLLGVLHLIDDDRPFSGIGQSHFLRGAVWTGEIARSGQGGAP